MKLKRMINGKEETITLTDQELLDAYLEYTGKLKLQDMEELYIPSVLASLEELRQAGDFTCDDAKYEKDLAEGIADDIYNAVSDNDVDLSWALDTTEFGGFRFYFSENTDF